MVLLPFYTPGSGPSRSGKRDGEQNQPFPPTWNLLAGWVCRQGTECGTSFLLWVFVHRDAALPPRRVAEILSHLCQCLQCSWVRLQRKPLLLTPPPPLIIPLREHERAVQVQQSTSCTQWVGRGRETSMRLGLSSGSCSCTALFKELAFAAHPRKWRKVSGKAGGFGISCCLQNGALPLPCFCLLPGNRTDSVGHF